MSETKHTPEPWEVRRDPSHFHTESDIHAEDRHIAVFGGRAEEQEANTRRAVACVNAMAGIADPAAFVASHARLLEAAKEKAVDLVEYTAGCTCRPCRRTSDLMAAISEAVKAANP